MAFKQHSSKSPCGQVRPGAASACPLIMQTIASITNQASRENACMDSPLPVVTTCRQVSAEPV
eukprot:scaffold277980_cov21-Tisochrysis_lutea.AAC.2